MSRMRAGVVLSPGSPRSRRSPGAGLQCPQWLPQSWRESQGWGRVIWKQLQEPAGPCPLQAWQSEGRRGGNSPLGGLPEKRVVGVGVYNAI